MSYLREIPHLPPFPRLSDINTEERVVDPRTGLTYPLVIRQRAVPEEFENLTIIVCHDRVVLDAERAELIESRKYLETSDYVYHLKVRRGYGYGSHVILFKPGYVNELRGLWEKETLGCKSANEKGRASEALNSFFRASGSYGPEGRLAKNGLVACVVEWIKQYADTLFKIKALVVGWEPRALGKVIEREETEEEEDEDTEYEEETEEDTDTESSDEGTEEDSEQEEDGEETMATNMNTNLVVSGNNKATLEEKAREAGYRVAANQFLKLVKEPLYAHLTKNLGGADSKKLIAFINTDIGEACLSSLLALALNQLPIENKEHLEKLSYELQIQAMTQVGNLLAGLLLEPVKQALGSMPKTASTP